SAQAGLQLAADVGGHRVRVERRPHIQQMQMAIDKAGHQESTGCVDLSRRLRRVPSDKADLVAGDSDARRAFEELLAVEDPRVLYDDVTRVCHRSGNLLRGFISTAVSHLTPVARQMEVAAEY